MNINYNEIKKFYDRFKKAKNIIWKDKKGETKFIFSEIKKIKDFDIFQPLLIISPFVEFKQGIKVKSKEITVISIGSAYENNIAKEICYYLKLNKKIKTKLIIIPISLSNDSFGTNRSVKNFFNITEQSHESLYPDKVIFDIKLIKKYGVNSNIYGIGEYIGLYCSIYDYYVSRGYQPVRTILNHIVERFNELVMGFGKNDNFLKLLAVSLIEKVLIMRTSLSYEIGAGIDHIISYGLKERYKDYSHGKLVYLASMISVALFPEMENYGLTLKKLIKDGVKIKIFEKKDLLNISKILNLEFIRKCLNMRRNRNTILRRVSKYNVLEAKNNLVKFFYEL